jgi:hypothetical protein
MKIVIFGASVTQQSVSKAGESTGYVPLLRKKLRSVDSSYEVVQMGYGSSSFDIAGFLHLEDVVNHSPDIVILEWHTTWLGRFDDQKYAYAIDHLLFKGIKVLNLILPRREYLSPERDCVKQSRGCIEKGAFFLNLIDQVGKGLDLDKCLRDNVHTTEHGADRYSDLIMKFLLEEVIDSASPICGIKDNCIGLPQSYERPIISRTAVNGHLNIGDTLHVEVYSDSMIHKPNIKFFASLRVGPRSGYICLRNFNDSMLLIWDEWCGYDRNALKPISPSIKTGRTEFEFIVPLRQPEYSSSKYDFSGVLDSDLNLVFNGPLFCTGAVIKDFHFERFSV